MDPQWLPVDWPNWQADHCFSWLRTHASHGPAKIRRMIRRYVEQQHIAWSVKSLHLQLKGILQTGGASFDTSTSDGPVPSNPTQCVRCGAGFATERKLAAHMWTACKIPSAERQFTPATFCLHCNVCFWTSQRLQQHLHYSRRSPEGCYAHITWQYQPLQHASVPMPAALRGHLRVPAQPAFGPVLDPSRVPQTVESALYRIQGIWDSMEFPGAKERECFSRVACAINDTLRAMSVDSAPVAADLVDQILQVVTDTVEGQWTEDHGAWALTIWFRDHCKAASFPMLPGTLFALFYAELEATLLALPIAQLLFWQWRIQDAHLVPAVDNVVAHQVQARLREHIPDWLRDLSNMLSSVVQPVSDLTPKRGIPVCDGPYGPELWIIHLFSGRRREADVHEWIAHYAEEMLPSFRVRVLSCDTAVDGQWGNLGPGANFQVILKLALQGLFAGSLAGPPCETWSAARYEQLVAEDGAVKQGPRPLRSFDSPWGVLGLSMKELHQVCMGSALLLHTWLVEAGIVVNGGAAIKEHPSPSMRPGAASSWTTPTHVGWMMQLPDACRHSLLQYLYGSVGVKPTDIRTINLGSATSTARDLSIGARPETPRPQGALIGLGRDGKFLTAAAKEYPRRLSQSLAFALVKGLQARIHAEGTRTCPVPAREDRSWLEGASQVSASRTERTTFLPDYQAR